MTPLGTRALSAVQAYVHMGGIEFALLVPIQTSEMRIMKRSISAWWLLFLVPVCILSLPVLLFLFFAANNLAGAIWGPPALWNRPWRSPAPAASLEDTASPNDAGARRRRAPKLRLNFEPMGPHMHGIFRPKWRCAHVYSRALVPGAGRTKKGG